MEKILLKARNRISEKRHSLNIFHCFSKEDMGFTNENLFGNLLSIKDYFIKPNMGILPHVHKNLELITIILSGKLVQKNNKGETYCLEPGDIQYMNAGSGLSHFEYNKSTDSMLNCIQLCLTPKSKQLEPHIKLSSFAEKAVGLHAILNNETKKGKKLKATNNYTFYYGFFEAGTQKKYVSKNKEKNIILLTLEGKIEVNDEIIEEKDTLLLNNPSELLITSPETSKFILIEVA